MNREETGKLMELIQLAYPYAYRDMDEGHMLATVRMWEASFCQIPYALVEECFNRYRMANRYAPTVADINMELKNLRCEAATAMSIHRQLGNRDMEMRFRRIYEAIGETAPARENYGQYFPDQYHQPYLPQYYL